MSQQTRPNLQTNINTDIADNVTGAITAGDVRVNMINMTDSVSFLTGSNSFDGDVTVTGSLIISGSSIILDADNAYNSVHITGGLDISRDLAVRDDLTVYDETDLKKETTIGYANFSNYDFSYQLNVTASSNSDKSARFDGGIVITGSSILSGSSYPLIVKGKIDLNDGVDNIAVGAGALLNAGSSIAQNTAVGKNTLYNTLGNSNTGLGYIALFNNTGGGGNVAVGGESIRNNTSGNNNSSVGYLSLKNNTTGDGNTALGKGAGEEVGGLTGNDNTFLGHDASYGTATTITNSTAVGANVTLTNSNTVILGNNANVGINNTNPTEKLTVQGNILASGNITGSAFTGSFVGDGSALTGITSTIADGSVTNIKLENDSVTLGTTEIDLGTASTTLAGLTDVKVTGSLTVSGSGNTNILGSFYVYGASPGTEFFSTAYTSNRVVSTWVDLGGTNLQTEIDPGSITLTSNFTDFLTLRDNGTTKGLSREDGMRFTRLSFETGTITTDGVITIPKDITGTIALELKAYTVASLPAGTVGDRAYVTDATSPTYLGTLTGGGAVTCPVFYNGSAWVSA